MQLDTPEIPFQSYQIYKDSYLSLRETNRKNIKDVNVSVIEQDTGSLRFAAWGKNLADEEYWNTAINMGIMTVNQWADPRSYGVEVGYDF